MPGVKTFWLAVCVLALALMAGCARKGGETRPGNAATAVPPTVDENDDKERDEMAEEVTAQIILRAEDGSSILDSDEPVTATTIARYQASEETIAEVSRKLEELGFAVLQPSPTSLTVSGTAALFESVFQTTLERRSADVMDVAGAETTYYEATEPFTIPQDLSDMVAGVTLSTPAQFYP